MSPLSHGPHCPVSPCQDLARYEAASTELALMTASRVAEVTGCLPPCSYNVYTVADTHTTEDRSQADTGDSVVMLLCREMAERGEVWLELLLASETVAVTSRGPATGLASLLAQLAGGLGLVCLVVALLVTRGQGQGGADSK